MKIPLKFDIEIILLLNMFVLDSFKYVDFWIVVEIIFCCNFGYIWGNCYEEDKFVDLLDNSCKIE